jgi:hypothetical protein
LNKTNQQYQSDWFSMSSHLHLVLRSRPDVAKEWTDDEVARRWLQVFPCRRSNDGSPVEPEEHEISMITRDKKRLAEIRLRLSDVSWWMRCTAENVARRSNREDQCSGRFWEGRFKAQVLLDEAAVLACAAYVDLNPIRAAMATTPETSEFTGAKDRLDDLAGRTAKSPQTHAWERSRRRDKSGWLSPLEIQERSDPAGPDLSPSARRASLKGFLPMSLVEYLDLLDWTGRQLRRATRGVIPSHLSPIIDRLGIDTSSWCDLVKKFGKLFKRAAGKLDSMSSEATRRGVGYMHAPGTAMFAPANE